MRKSRETMVQLVSGEWHCPHHALLLAAKDLVSLYSGAAGTDWVAISAVVDRDLPRLIARAEVPTNR